MGPRCFSIAPNLQTLPKVLNAVWACSSHNVWCCSVLVDGALTSISKFFKASQIHRPFKLHPPPAMAPTNTCLRQRTDNAFRVSSLGLSQSFVGNLVLFREK